MIQIHGWQVSRSLGHLDSNQLWKPYCKMSCIVLAGNSWKRKGVKTGKMAGWSFSCLSVERSPKHFRLALEKNVLVLIKNLIFIANIYIYYPCFSKDKSHKHFTCPCVNFICPWQGSYGSWKSWKVMEFDNCKFQAWKVLDFQVKSLKVMEK